MGNGVPFRMLCRTCAGCQLFSGELLWRLLTAVLKHSHNLQLPWIPLQGTVEMIQLSSNQLTGSLPACLFNGNSTLWQLSVAYNQLEGR